MIKLSQQLNCAITQTHHILVEWGNLSHAERKALGLDRRSCPNDCSKTKSADLDDPFETFPTQVVIKLSLQEN